MELKVTRQERDNGTHEYQYAHVGPRAIAGWGNGAAITVLIRFDDHCKNGHDTFSITADIRRPGRRDIEAGGCLHEEIVRVFPELSHLIKWHLMSTDGPMHYIANTVYFAGDRDHWGLRKGEKKGEHYTSEGKERQLDYARRSSIWIDAPDSVLCLEKEELTKILEGRLPALIAEFRGVMESLGFSWIAKT